MEAVRVERSWPPMAWFIDGFKYVGVWGYLKCVIRIGFGISIAGVVKWVDGRGLPTPSMIECGCTCAGIVQQEAAITLLLDKLTQMATYHSRNLKA
jgi:hypothetical protein